MTFSGEHRHRRYVRIRLGLVAPALAVKATRMCAETSDDASGARNGSRCERDPSKVNRCYHAVGLLFLLFVWGGAITTGLDLGDEWEHRLARAGALPVVIGAPDRFPSRQTTTPRTRVIDAAASAQTAWPRCSLAPTAHATLLSQNCLLAV